MGHIRGLVFHSRLDYIKQNLDFHVRKALKSNLSPQADHLFSEQIFPVNLYPFRFLKELDEALVKVSSEPAPSLFARIGQRFAAVITDRYFFNYMQQHQAQKFLKQFQLLYPQLWGFGEYEVQFDENGRAHLFFQYPVTIHTPYEIFMEAFLKTSLEICGAKKIQLKSQKCNQNSEDCRTYFVEWK